MRLVTRLWGDRTEPAAKRIEVLSFHPFSSPMESVYLFSTYDRRIEEMIQLYSEFFGTMKRLGAKIFVLHGAILSSKCPAEHYVKQFRLLAETGRKYGVTVAQENVSYCLSGDLEFLKMMKRELGGYARFVLDLKQVRRAHGDTFEYIRALGENIVHLHISDGSVERDCLPVGHGEFDFRRLMQGMDALGYSGAYMMELYRQNYDEFGPAQGVGGQAPGHRGQPGYQIKKDLLIYQEVSIVFAAGVTRIPAFSFLPCGRGTLPCSGCCSRVSRRPRECCGTSGLRR